jgi:hypothetical protein
MDAFIIGYDRGDYNDFLLRQRLFSHWRKLYFDYIKNKFQKIVIFKNKIILKIMEIVIIMGIIDKVICFNHKKFYNNLITKK